MQTNTTINKSLKITCISLLAILFSGITYGQEISITGTNGEEGVTDGIYILKPLAPASTFSAGGTITISFSGTATEGTDYTVLEKTITYNTGDVSIPVTLNITNDDVVENTETVIITLVSVTGSATIGVSNNISIDLTDNDEALLSISSSSPITEDGTHNAFTVISSNVITTDLTVTVTASGSATEGSDYLPLTSPYTLISGQTSFTIPITVTSDNLAEGDETIILSLSDPAATNVNLGVSSISTIITDDDNANFILIPNGPIAVNEGSTDQTFSVVLSAQPISDVVIKLTSDNPLAADVDKTLLTFSNSTWNTEQIVSISAQQDANLIDENVTVTAAIVDEDSDDAFDIIPNKTISINVSDDDTANFILTPNGPIAVNEGSTDQTFSVVLSAQPISDVVIKLTSDNPMAADIDKPLLTFSNSTWNTEQIVSISAQQDANLIDENVTVTAAIVDEDSDDAFDFIPNKTISINVSDDDTANFILTPNGPIAVNEGSTDQTFSVVLSAQPISDVVIKLTSDNPLAADIDKPLLTFSNSTWNTEQIVSISAQQDANLIDENVTVTAAIVDEDSDDAFDIIPNKTISINVSDDDEAGYELSSTPINITEGTTQQFSIVLTAQPQSNVIFEITSENTDIVTVNNNLLTFGQDNYNDPQIITVFCPEDINLIDETSSITIAIDKAASDIAFSNLANEIISVTTLDNDEANFTVSVSSIAITEGNTEQFTVVLTSQPESNVVFDISSTDTDIAFLSDSQLTFEPSNYNIPQTITVTCPEDANLTDETTSITVAVNATESNDLFDALSKEIIAVNTTDDDNAGYTISSNSINITEGSSQQFTVLLTAQPQNNVIFNIISENTNIVSVNSPQLTFEPGNYNIAQTITLSCPEDVNLIGETTSVIISVNSASDNAFDPLPDEVITVNSIDNDAPGYTVSTGSITITEGESKQFSVILTAQPQDDVLIDITSSNTAVAIVSNAQLVFNNSTWNTAQYITISIPEDNNLANESTTILASINNASDNDFTGIASQTININTTDNDFAPVFTSSPVESIDEDTFYSYSIVITDDDNDIPVISLETNISWLTLTDNGDGTATLTGTPENADVGTYIVRIRVTDDLTFTEQEYQLIVKNINDAPIANDDSDTTSDIAAVTTDVLANDVDDDGNIDISSLTIIQAPYHGTVTIENNTGRIIFTPDAHYFGFDSYQYQICDTDGECAIATVTINIINGNVKPVTLKDFITTNEDTPVNISPISNDSDPNGNIDIGSLKLDKEPDFGSYSINKATATINYQPILNYYGNDTIIYTICDLGNPSLCSIDTIFISVLPINDTPVATDHHINVTEGIKEEVHLATLGSDVENDLLSIEISPETPDIPGSINIINNSTLQFTANFGTLCTDHEIWYIIKDIEGAYDSGILFIHIMAFDSDLDNIPDALEMENGTELDSDSDGIPNHLDSDSDNDGIDDFIEGGIDNACTDTLSDSDKDGIPDYIDPDSDNDTIYDREESDKDCDNDGIPNYRDNFDDCSDRINAPDTFTPNGDGINDKFVIKGATSDELKDNELFIFNRWGGQVYHMVNYDNSWDGKSNSSLLGSELLSEGTYFYVFKTNAGKTLKGTVYIKR